MCPTRRRLRCTSSPRGRAPEQAPTSSVRMPSRAQAHACCAMSNADNIVAVAKQHAADKARHRGTRDTGCRSRQDIRPGRTRHRGSRHRRGRHRDMRPGPHQSAGANKDRGQGKLAPAATAGGQQPANAQSIVPNRLAIKVPQSATLRLDIDQSPPASALAVPVLAPAHFTAQRHWQR
jgi:hypothetical protein